MNHQRGGSAPADGGIADRLDRAFRYLGAATVVLALVIAALFAYVLGSLRPDQLRSGSGARSVQLAHQAMIDQETGLRGYLLLDDAAFLEPYREGVDALRAHSAETDQRVGSIASVARLVMAMRLAEQAWTSQWAVVVAENRAPSDPDELASFLDEGKELFDAYRARQQELSDFLNLRRDELQRREGIAFGLGLGIMVIVLTALALVMERQRRDLRRALIEPVNAIVTATEGIAAGDMQSRVTTQGPAEFQRIAASVNQMGEALTVLSVDARARSAVIEQQGDHLREILSMAREVAGSLSLRYVLQSVTASAVTVSGFPRVTVWLHREGGAGGSLIAAHDSAAPDEPSASVPTIEVGVGVVGQAIKYGRTTTENAQSVPSVEVHVEHPLRQLAIPLIVGAQVIGALEFSSPEPALLTSGSLEVLETLAIHAAAAIEAARLHSQAEALSHTDALTGLANRRSLDRDLIAECERSARYERPLALIMFDVDHFKAYNDAWGHQRGDEALQELAATVVRELRGTDTAYRYGGEEFAVLARETNSADAAVLAERLRNRIQEHFASDGTLSPITASFGIGLVPPGEPRPELLIGSADAALYVAKANGRNRVETDVPPPDGVG
jgi:diguanylate cyclase (GGDEF)-like protein